MKDCIFCKIVNQEIPSKLIFENDHVVAFNDINPKAPTHILVIPKEHIEDFYDASESLFAEISKALKQLVKETELLNKGYTIEVNGGGFQEVFHLHFHLMGPKKTGRN